MRIPIGAIIVSCFAIIWTAAGSRDLRRPWFTVLLSSSVLISVAIVVAAGQIQPAHPVRFNARAYNWSIGFETIFILLAVIFLTKTDRKYLLLPVISLIVGLHFFGMIWALGSNNYWWIGTAMCFLPIVTMSILPRNLWMPVVGLGCALILWLSAIWALF
jgi:hypothetical protein